ncbi:MAG: phosphoenolpyruvate--protein phosphotransferase [Spirochaetes bacterium]|nr:phosphoenolpyruvate--protein phosphotransferase [Spirochaetota bacterium]
MATDHVQMLCDIGELNSIFTGSMSINEFLDKTVEMVAHHMKADVCSILLLDEQTNELVMRANFGLDKGKVKNIRLKLGEGLAGLSLQEMRPICEENGKQNPHFISIPAMKEDQYASFLAVPITRGLSRIGTLVLQRKRKHHFKEIDINSLRAITSQLAGAIENARILMDMEKVRNPTPTQYDFAKIDFLPARIASEGLVFGKSVVYYKKRFFSDFPDEKIYTAEEFETALKKTIVHMEESQNWVEEKMADSASLIFTAHLLILKDKYFTGEMAELIKNGINPPIAIQIVTQNYLDIFQNNENPVFREKVHDIEDVANRLLKNLCSYEENEDKYSLSQKIIIARDLFPSEILKLAAEEIKGIILCSGGVTSHLSILCRSLQIPLVIVDEKGLLHLPDNTDIILDAENGKIYINPDKKTQKNYDNEFQLRSDIQVYQKEINPSTASKDQVKIKIQANINLFTDIKMANQMKSEGVGLYRTEFPFILRHNFPTEEEQYYIYKKLIDNLNYKEITFRTLDVGGDKALSYYEDLKENNPFLGLRSIRFSLQNKEIFIEQIRAILRAGSDIPLRITFPMISSLSEILAVKKIIRECQKALKKEKLPHNPSPQVGMMIEIPSIVELIDDFSKEVDFFSIGTNDFIQYMLAVDRTNERVSHLYVPHHPAVLRALNHIISTAIKYGKDIAVCGNMAHQEEYIPILLGMGIRTLSIDPRRHLKVQNMVEKIEIKKARQFTQKILKQKTVDQINPLLDEMMNSF